MIIAPAVQLSEPVTNCTDCGGAMLASRGCALCAFDAKYVDAPLGTCSDCGAGLTGLDLTCSGCDAEAAGRALHAQLLASARRGVAGAVRSADSALALAALVVGDDAADVAFADLVDALDAAA